ncbi:MarR family winged helix-turn-helix transcriptional regulator [Enterococcus sp. DIV0125]|uniref:MarR family winged helix-turn-helix transcriptional regulator n=1 Tax=Enterococcus sp. DIV0125 TaxID=2774796 RepID=UPI003D2FBEA0
MEQTTQALNVFIGLLRVSGKLEAVVKKDVKNYGLNITEFSVLEFLYHKGKQTPQTIQERILIASSSTTYVIDKLVAKGLAERKTNQADRRETYVAITDPGCQLMAEIFPQHATTIGRCFADFELDELLQLEKLLKKVKDN